VRAWVEVWDDSLDDAARKRRLETWFGFADQPIASDDEAHPRRTSQAGAFRFFDALPIKPVSLRADVMTPHQGKWYEQGGAIEDCHREPDKVPADWHAPVPVPFLVAERPQLLFPIAPRQAAAAGELAAVFQALKQALEWLGAGAKTAAGYGLMQEDHDQTRRLEAEQAEQRRQRAQAEEAKRQHAAREAERARLDPFERALLELIDARPDKNQSAIVYLIGMVKDGRWQGEEKRRVAQWLEQRMKNEKGQWKPQSQAKKPEKDRPHQNTLLVMQWLAHDT
jgi:CRISPR-associated protein Cmr6